MLMGNNTSSVLAVELVQDILIQPSDVALIGNPIRICDSIGERGSMLMGHTD